MKILITDGNNRAALAATRSLGKAGWKVIVMAEKLPALASVSRYCIKAYRYPDPESRPENFIKTVLSLTRKEAPDVIMPIAEVTTLLVLQNRQYFEKYSRIPFGNHATVCKAASKLEILKIAERIGIPIPQSIFLEDASFLPAAKDFWKKIQAPIVVKPSRSKVLRNKKYLSTTVQYASSWDELQRLLQEELQHVYPIILQERIQGPGVGIFTCFDSGRMLAVFSHKRLREKPPSGGVSVLRKSIPVHPLLRKYSETLLSELKWHGVAMVEYKRDADRGGFKLMEVNGRFWGSLQLGIDAGVNFPRMAAELAMGKKIASVQTYRTGVATRWFWGDVDVLLARLMKSYRSLDLPQGYPGKLKSVGNFLKLKQPETNYEIFNKGDIKPWLLETLFWLTKRA